MAVNHRVWSKVVTVLRFLSSPHQVPDPADGTPQCQSSPLPKEVRLPRGGGVVRHLRQALEGGHPVAPIGRYPHKTDIGSRFHVALAGQGIRASLLRQPWQQVPVRHGMDPAVLLPVDHELQQPRPSVPSAVDVVVTVLGVGAHGGAVGAHAH